MGKNVDGLEKLQRVDHDTLIRLEGKVDSMASDVKEMKDGTTMKLADHESRITVIEKDHAAMGGAKEAYARFILLEQRVHDYAIEWKTTIAIASAIGGVVGVIIDFLLKFLGIIKLA